MVKVLIINFQSKDYSLPEFVKAMNQLKVLIITNYGFVVAEVNDLPRIEHASGLRRIRLEHISVSSLVSSSLQLKNLKKISLIMCEIGKALNDWAQMFPNVTEIEIDCCHDLVELPSSLCNLVGLKKLSITSCNELSKLPPELGKMKNLKVLRLNSCTKLEELPDSIVNLTRLNFLDISDCLKITRMPTRIGELRGLKTLHMQGCRGLIYCEELLSLVEKLRGCDEDAILPGKDYDNAKVFEVKEMMGGGRRKLVEITKMRNEVIAKACELSLNAYKMNLGVEPFVYYEYPRPLLEVVFAFAQSWSVSDWFSGSSTPFGITKINLDRFPFLKSIGTEDIALVNDVFADRFEAILKTTSLRRQVLNAVIEGKKIVFAGHSSGGPMAILTTLWFLNKYTRINGNTTPLCLTFGSPLMGSKIFSHALKRENWARYFIHFVAGSDIIPIITLSPLSSIKNELQQVFDILNPKNTKDKAISQTNASTFLTTVLENASSVASYAASNFMGGRNLLVETFSSFIDHSPYRPFGTFIFCNAHDKLVVAENSDVVLQLLVHFSKSQNEADIIVATTTRLKEHMAYDEVLKNRANLQDMSCVDHPEETNWALNDLGLSRRVKLCLRAVEELEKVKKKNQESLKKDKIKEGLKKIQDYQIDCERRQLGYYDSFKLQNDQKDFIANVTRLQLTGMWNEVTEKLKNYQLPDEFESQKEWIELGTRHRRLVEPLDVANYYRHEMEEKAGTYLERGRHRLYSWHTQGWLEPYENIKSNSISESCFMAEVEDIKLVSKKKSFDDLKERITSLEENILKWIQNGVLRSDVFLERSTFSQWWNSLPDQHKQESCIRKYFIEN